jgi:hypothetical protein
MPRYDNSYIQNKNTATGFTANAADLIHKAGLVYPKDNFDVRPEATASSSYRLAQS